VPGQRGDRLFPRQDRRGKTRSPWRIEQFPPVQITLPWMGTSGIPPRLGRGGPVSERPGPLTPRVAAQAADGIVQNLDEAAVGRNGERGPRGRG